MQDESHAKSRDLAELRNKLPVAPFHRCLGLDIVELTERELIIEMPRRDDID
ncbi:MAG: hypothetical protein ACO1OD_01610 [Croceibacterium sp.]|jgi:hypothetical protein